MEPALAVATIMEELRSETRIRALFLSGSHGVGFQDAYSDLDFLMVSEEGATDEVSSIWRRAVGRTGEILLWWDRQVRPTLINAISGDWLRTDVVIVKPAQMSGQTRDRLKVLFDHDGIYETLPRASKASASNPQRTKYQFEEFIRILGLLPLAMGREEYLNAVTGLFHLRNLIVELLIEETAAPHRGGALHLNRLITVEQKEMLASLPPAVPERVALISAHLAYAAAYLPRARRLSLERGIDWPDRLEAAMWERLKAELGVDRPYALD